jgi:hypothetical protein
MLLNKVFTTQNIVVGEEKFNPKDKIDALEVRRKEETKTQISLK